VGYPAAVLHIDLAERALRGEPPTRDEALAVLKLSDAETPCLVASVSRVRRRFFGDRVKLNFLLNIKSGLCPEDCGYCSQSKLSTAPIQRYRMLTAGEAVAAAAIAAGTGARRFCMVASGRGPTPRELDLFAAAVRAVRAAQPQLEVCACLGLLAEGQAERLAEAGVHAYNHNLNTSEDHYERICGTHTFADRVDTLRRATAAGLSPCSGALFGMGETDEDVVDVGFALRELRPDSVPVNFLIPIAGTPLGGRPERLARDSSSRYRRSGGGAGDRRERPPGRDRGPQKPTPEMGCMGGEDPSAFPAGPPGRHELTPWRCLRILALYRLLFPDSEVRIAGGREVHLRSLQPLGLLLANSIFAGDYLTTRGQAAQADLDMIADMGLRVEGAGPPAPARRPPPVELKTERR
jgi:biotin synthase